VEACRALQETMLCERLLHVRIAEKNQDNPFCTNGGAGDKMALQRLTDECKMSPFHIAYLRGLDSFIPDHPQKIYVGGLPKTASAVQVPEFNPNPSPGPNPINPNRWLSSCQDTGNSESLRCLSRSLVCSRSLVSTKAFVSVHMRICKMVNMQ